MQPRFDEKRQVYRDCKWCGGAGCLCCRAEADKAYKSMFPDGAKPIATFDISTPEGVEIARNALSPESLTKAFGPGGDGFDGIIKRAHPTGTTP